MSFAINVVGTPEGLKRALAEYSERQTEPSKTEFDAVKPAIETVIDQNVPFEGHQVLLHVEASGHASFVDGVKKYGTARINVRQLEAAPAL